MAEPTQKEIQEFLRRYPRDITAFMTISQDNRTIKSPQYFYLYGFKIEVKAKCFVILTPSVDAPSEERWKYKYSCPGHPFSITPILFLNNGQIKRLSQIDVIIKEGYEQRIQTTAIIQTGYAINKVVFEVAGEFEINIKKDGGWWHDGNGVRTWYWSGSTIPTCKITNVYLYEHPYIDSGMRITGHDGKIYIPAETVFPSPFRIYHKRVRNIMLVPFGHEHASIFKIKTKDGIRAISTII